MEWLTVLAVIVGGGVLFVAMRERRNGDFQFRIEKLRHRTSEVVSELMKLREESEYLSLYQDRLNEGDLRRLSEAMDRANAVAVEVSDRLNGLRARARSWFNFSDLYVGIGEQEERLEEAEGLTKEGRALFARLDAQEKEGKGSK